jgi:hypothetical protein
MRSYGSILVHEQDHDRTEGISVGPVGHNHKIPDSIIIQVSDRCDRLTEATALAEIFSQPIRKGGDLVFIEN